MLRPAKIVCTNYRSGFKVEPPVELWYFLFDHLRAVSRIVFLHKWKNTNALASFRSRKKQYNIHAESWVHTTKTRTRELEPSQRRQSSTYVSGKHMRHAKVQIFWELLRQTPYPSHTLFHVTNWKSQKNVGKAFVSLAMGFERKTSVVLASFSVSKRNRTRSCARQSLVFQTHHFDLEYYMLLCVWRFSFVKEGLKWS